MERDLGTRLEWVAIDHHNTDDAHVHLLIRGVRDDGQVLTLDRDYVRRGIRELSQELIERELGPRLEREVLLARGRTIEREQWTEIDRALKRRAGLDRVVSYENFEPYSEGARVRAEQEIERLQYPRKTGAGAARSMNEAGSFHPSTSRSCGGVSASTTSSRAGRESNSASATTIWIWRGEGSWRSIGLIGLSTPRAQARLTQVKLVSVSGFILLALLINWRVTEHRGAAIRLFARAGAVPVRRLYAPWEWIVWWSRWHWVEHFQPVWELCIREAAYALLALAAGTAGVIVVARYLLSANQLGPAWFGALGGHARRESGGPHRAARIPSPTAAAVGRADWINQAARAPGRDLSGNLARIDICATAARAMCW